MGKLLEVLRVVGNGGRANDVSARSTKGAGDVGGAERGEVAAIGDVWDGTVIRECGLEVVDAESERHNDDYKEKPSKFGSRADKKLALVMLACLMF